MSTTRNWEWMMKVILVHVLQFPLKEQVCEQFLLPILCQFRVGDGKSCTSRVHEPWNGWEVGIPFNSGWEYIEIWPNGANNVTNTTGKLWVKSSWGRPLILYDLHIFSIFPIYFLLNIHKLFQWPLNSHRVHGGHVDLGLKVANTKTKPSLLCSWPVWMLRKRMIKRSYLGDFNCQQRGPCVEIWITSRSITPGVPHQRTSTLVHAVHDSHHPAKMWSILVEIEWVMMRHMF